MIKKFSTLKQFAAEDEVICKF